MEVELLCLPTEHDPLGRAVAQITDRFAREVWQVYYDQRNTKEHLNLPELVHLVDEVKGARITEGPIATLRWALMKVGWKLEKVNVWSRQNGEEMDVTFASPAYVNKLVMQDWETAQWKDAQEYLCGVFDQWTTCKVSRKLQGLARRKWCQWLVAPAHLAIGE